MCRYANFTFSPFSLSNCMVSTHRCWPDKSTADVEPTAPAVLVSGRESGVVFGCFRCVFIASCSHIPWYLGESLKIFVKSKQIQLEPALALTHCQHLQSALAHDIHSTSLEMWLRWQPSVYHLQACKPKVRPEAPYLPFLTRLTCTNIPYISSTTAGRHTSNFPPLIAFVSTFYLVIYTHS